MFLDDGMTCFFFFYLFSNEFDKLEVFLLGNDCFPSYKGDLLLNL